MKGNWDNFPNFAVEDSDVIPGLKFDLALHCLSYIPGTFYSVLAQVCKTWRNLVRGKELRESRRRLGLLQPCIFMLVEDVKVGSLHLLAYEPVVQKWHSLKPLNHIFSQMEGADRNEAINGFALAAVDNRLYLIGGFDRRQDGHDRCLSSVFRYDLCSNDWNRVSNMHSPRFLFASGVLDGKVYVAGGIYFNSNSHVRDRTLNAEFYIPEKDQWFRLPDTQLQRLRGPDFGLLLDNKFTILSEDASSLAEAYDRDLRAWTAICGPPLPDRPTKVIAAPGNRVCVLQNLWPWYKYKVCLRDQGILSTLAEWSADNSKTGPVKHPREMVAIGEKVFLIGNEHPRAVRKRHGYQGPNPVEVAVYDLGASKNDKEVKWEKVEGKQWQHGSWVMGCAVMEI